MTLLRTPATVTGTALVLILSGCAASSPGAAPAPVGPDAVTFQFEVPPAIQWTRTAAEHRMVYLTVFQTATEAVESASAGLTEPWGVIVDADETLLDNSLYQLERARLGQPYTSESWNDWVRRRAAGALPGAREFLRQVKALGGYVAVVTNRDAIVCPETRRNLEGLALPFDVVLCREPGSSEKETRFEMVQDGETPAGLPPLRIVAWVGDNIEDFPEGTQGLRNAAAMRLGEFGRRYFVLPNPMYGSWTSNPVR